MQVSLNWGPHASDESKQVTQRNISICIPETSQLMALRGGVTSKRQFSQSIGHKHGVLLDGLGDLDIFNVHFMVEV